MPILYNWDLTKYRFELTVRATVTEVLEFELEGELDFSGFVELGGEP